MVKGNPRRPTGDPERADAERAAYRATWPASGAGRGWARRACRRPSAARSAHLASAERRACRADWVVGRADLAGRPSPLTSFVGRDDDLSGVLKNLGGARLVTLTGPGGVGKTRLATEVSGRLDVPAWFVPLAPGTDS